LGSDSISIEVLRCLVDLTIAWLNKLFNNIFWSNKMADEWRNSTLVSIFKNKKNIYNCINYKGIKFMSHFMKLWERVIEHRLRELTIVFKNQFHFILRMSIMDATFFDTMTYREIPKIKIKEPTYDIYWFREKNIWKNIQKISYNRRLKRI
jgi:hypothetical protein